MWAVFLEALIVAPPFLDMCVDICGAYGWLAVLSTNIKTQQRLDILGLLWPFNVNKNYLYTVLCATFNYPFCSWITMTTFANLMLISHLMGNWWGEGGGRKILSAMRHKTYAPSWSGKMFTHPSPLPGGALNTSMFTQIWGRKDKVENWALKKSSTPPK